MQWDWQDRRLRLSVGELAGFNLSIPGEPGAARWRMELGTHWHNVLRQRAEAEDVGWKFEQSVSGPVEQSGWTFDLQGRIDQIQLSGDQTRVREVKTVSMELPADESLLRSSYPAYFHQAMLYGFLCGRSGPFPAVELLFLEYKTGTSQTVQLGEDDLAALHGHLCEVVESLEERRKHFHELRNFVVPEPFREWRPGQALARDTLDAALDRARAVLLEAPTGFGKTGLVLEQALLRLAAGSVNRVLLLTGKNTGHEPIIRQLERFQASGPGLTVAVLRSREDLTLDAELERAMTPDEIQARWKASGLSVPNLLAEGILNREELLQLGSRHNIPPWVIGRMLLPFADVWIADYNYRFDPRVCQVIESVPTWDPASTFLVVDEAHNLPSRAAASRSHCLARDRLDNLLTEARFARFPGPLIRCLDQLLSLIRSQSPVDELDPPVEADLIGLLRDTQEAAKDSSFGFDELSSENADWLWRLPGLLADWDHPALSFHLWAPEKGRIEMTCLDAAPVIGPEINRYAQSVLMSATLRPWDTCRISLGLGAVGSRPGRMPFLELEAAAPWLEGCFEVLVDARVDTRFHQRQRYFDTTANTLAETVSVARGCTVAFFPSYLYAAQVLERIQFLYPSLRAEIQPRAFSLEDQQAFLERALLMDDLLLLVLGSRFSEGIDALGGRISRAVVVGPALPEADAVQRAREMGTRGGARAAFREIYIIPGLRKISQALGRLVRSPGHSARILLQCKRFLEPEYQDLLPDYLKPQATIVTDADLAQKWLRRD